MANDLPFKSDFVLEAPLAAMFQYRQMADQDEMEKAKLQEQTLKSIYQQLQNDRYAGQTPGEIAKTDYEGKLARAKSDDPGYIDWQLKGQVGQMKTQDAAGNTAQVLAPFKQQSERAELENSAAENTLLGKFNKARLRAQDQTLPESDRISAQQEANVLREEISNSPKFLGQQKLQDDKLDNALAIAELRRQQKDSEKKSKAETAWVNFQKAKPEVRLGITKQALATGIDPFTGDPLTQQQRQQMQALYDQDALVLRELARQRQAGRMNLPAMTGGQVVNNPDPNFVLGDTPTPVQPNDPLGIR